MAASELIPSSGTVSQVVNDSMSDAALISDEYKNLQEKFHVERPDYGSFSHKYGPLISKLIESLEIDEVLDYGAGKCALGSSLKPNRRVRYWPYDPCIPEIRDVPGPKELVVCTDVLEHIEPEKLDNVLDHIKELTAGICFLAIHTGPAKKKLPDGRNAHLIQEDYKWWLPKIWERFDIERVVIKPFCVEIIARRYGDKLVF